MKRSHQKKKRINPYLGYGLLIVLVCIQYGKDSLYFNNGGGGKNWRIGAPLVNPVSAFPGRTLSELRQQALLLVNRDRKLNGLPPLREDPLIAHTAQKHADDMVNRNFYAHVNPDGQSPTDRYRANGGIGGIGENIVYQDRWPGVVLSYGLAERFQRSWMYSEGHRKNLLTPGYTKFGYGISIDRVTGKVYAVQNFQ
ncbi:CAP domain-containing protein [Pannus brasiliensis CCIBt3594]|uniref:CAP domain-containing protein n=1 Tax=Pannus brasiliensis CCIBt3594 TaxID=1427578 RepID=A0AAW9QQJ4_9CHRO